MPSLLLERQVFDAPFLHCLIHLVLPRPKNLKLTIVKTPKEPLCCLEGRGFRLMLPANLSVVKVHESH